MANTDDLKTILETNEVKHGGNIADNLGLALHRCSDESKSMFLIGLNTFISEHRVAYDNLTDKETQEKLAIATLELHSRSADKYLLDDTVATKTAIYDYLSFVFYDRYSDLNELMNAVMRFNAK